MKNTVTLNRNCDFLRLYGRGKVYTDPALVIYLLKNRAGICRIGITGSHKEMKELAIKMIRFYQRKISPLFPPRCRYYPTCSQYAVTAIERFGIIRGGLLAVWRLLRCNPLFPGGLDPVPEKRNKKKG